MTRKCKVGGVVYVESSRDENTATSLCSGCVGETNDALCDKLAVCSDVANDKDFIWVVKNEN